MRRTTMLLVLFLLLSSCSGGSTTDSEDYLCNPVKTECVGDFKASCNSDGKSWASMEECEHGCTDGACEPPPCEAACTNKECGTDGCDGECGSCPAAAPVCEEGICKPDCTPECEGKECGPDGCEGECGKCPGLAPLCVDGVCHPDCTTDCAGKECGDDGCGDLCGNCPAGKECISGECKCVPQCDGKDCGIDGCGGVCGKCTGQDTCEEGKCVCQPACDGAECGPDGCAGTCGTCQPGAECVGDQCYCEPEADIACCGDAICWLDSCGDEGEVKASCALGCEGGECVLPQQVAVWVEEAVLGVHDIEGKYWDIDLQVSKELLKQVSSYLKKSGQPWSTVAGFLLDLFAGPLMEHFEKPDPYGTARVMLNGVLAPEYDKTIPQQEDTYHTVWTGIGWSDLPVEGGLAVKLLLMDADFGFWNDDDPFGTVQIDKQEILDAMNNPGDPDKCWVDVSAESSQTVLLVKIAAYPTELPCAPSCGGKVCGSDGCGGSCGVCLPGELCTSDGACAGDIPEECNGISFEGCCVGDSLVWCEDGGLTGGDCGEYPSCGWSEDVGYYNCGTDGAEEPSGTFPLACPPGTCPPKCENMQCGDDGCGGSCGECAEGKDCQLGQCVPLTDGCGGISWEGCCEGTVAIYCDAGELNAMDCATAPLCGWSDEYGYTCGTNGGADPSGAYVKDCGLCVPDCGEKECGDDGCGGSCGQCEGEGECVGGTCTGTQECDKQGFVAAGGEGCGYTLDPYEFLVYEAYSAAGSPYDILRVEVYPGFGGPTEPGTYLLTGENYASCTLCVVAYAGCTAEQCQEAFLAQSGYVVIESISSVGGVFSGAVEEASLAQVTIDSEYTSTPVSGGETWCVDAYEFSAAVEQM